MNKMYFQKRNRFPFGFVAIVFLFLILLVLILQNCENKPKPTYKMYGSEQTSNPETTVQKNDGSISIPGFEMLELKANSKQQTIALANPPQNNCYFEISLYLEDGTLLWKSELIEPGKTSKALVLTKKLVKGHYSDAVLRYNCYRMDEDRSPLNGAETKVTLWVK